MISPESIKTTRVERKSHRLRQKRVAAAAAVLALILIGTCAMAASASLKPRVPLNTYVAGINVGGLTRAEAAQRLTADLQWDQRTVTVRWANGEVTGSEQCPLTSLGLHADVDETIKRLNTTMWWGKARDRRDVPLRVTLDDAVFSEAVSRFRESIDRPAHDARLIVDDKDTVQIVKEIPGLSVDVESFADALAGNGEWVSLTGEIDLPVAAVEPEVTEKTLRGLGITGLLSSYSTAVNKDKDRTENIRLAAMRIDNYILAPGQVFSFNDVVGPRSAENGYKETPVYWRDEIRTGLGGGVCQLSTTLYNTVLLANLDIVERHPHSLTVDYVPLGRDAAVSYGEVDFKFRNSTSNHIMLKAQVADGKVSIKMFGSPAEGQKVAIKATVLKTIDFETETIEDPSVPKGQTQVRNGKPGYVVRSERVVYVAGEQVKKEVLGVSSYYPLKKQIKVAPGAGATQQETQPDGQHAAAPSLPLL